VSDVAHGPLVSLCVGSDLTYLKKKGLPSPTGKWGNVSFSWLGSLSPLYSLLWVYQCMLWVSLSFFVRICFNSFSFFLQKVPKSTACFSQYRPGKPTRPLTLNEDTIWCGFSTICMGLCIPYKFTLASSFLVSSDLRGFSIQSYSLIFGPSYIRYVANLAC
jgi:hypothetical protein